MSSGSAAGTAVGNKKKFRSPPQTRGVSAAHRRKEQADEAVLRIARNWQGQQPRVVLFDTSRYLPSRRKLVERWRSDDSNAELRGAFGVRGPPSSKHLGAMSSITQDTSFPQIQKTAPLTARTVLARHFELLVNDVTLGQSHTKVLKASASLTLFLTAVCSSTRFSTDEASVETNGLGKKRPKPVC